MSVHDVLRSACAIVTYHAPLLSAAKASRALAQLLEEVPWERENVVMYGRVHKARRRVCAYGDDGVSYRYAGTRKPARPWTPTLLKLKRKVEAATGQCFNFVLLNRYDNGDDMIGYHADDVRDLRPQSTIASLSLGAERDFFLKPASQAAKAITSKTVKKRLEHGSLLCMSGNTQTHYKHSVPARRSVTNVRVNATFRQCK